VSRIITEFNANTNSYINIQGLSYYY